MELYADYDTKMLLPFLRSSQHYTLEKVCRFIEQLILVLLKHQTWLKINKFLLNAGIWTLCEKRSTERASIYSWKNGKFKTSPFCYHKWIRWYGRGSFLSSDIAVCQLSIYKTNICMCMCVPAGVGVIQVLVCVCVCVFCLE